MKSEIIRPTAYGFLGAAIFSALTHAGPAIAQVNGSLPSFLKLQATTPGTAQTGNSNITGTSKAGQFVGGGAGVTGVNADLLDGLDSSAFLTGVPVPLTLSGSVSGGGLLSVSNTSLGSFAYGIFSEMPTNASSSSVSIYGRNLAPGGTAILGNALSASGSTVGVQGGSSSPTGIGVFGYSTAGSGSPSGVTGRALSPAGDGVFGDLINVSGTGNGVHGRAAGTAATGVFGEATATTGITFGVSGLSASTSGRGVYGESSATTGVTYGIRGESASTDGRGVYGAGTALGASDTPYGVRGQASTTTLGYAVYAVGDSGASGLKSFRIDHPADPENKYLLHYSSESPFPQNFYNGIVTTDASGYAWVELPGYFAEINTNFKYQLTVVDTSDSSDFVWAKVVQKISGNRFRIRSNKAGVEVSWRIEADRNDLRVRFNRPTDERLKTGAEKGKYQHPEYYNQPASMGMDYDENSQSRTKNQSNRNRPPVR